MIDIRAIYRSPNASEVKIHFEFNPADFDGIDLLEPVKVEASLMKLEEGILLIFEDMNTLAKQACVKCFKELQTPVQVQEGDWLFYEKAPLDYDDENELLYIDKDRWEINPFEAVRQELMLALPVAPRCEEDCVHFDESENGVKALAGLKDLFL